MWKCTNTPPNVLSKKDRIIVIGDLHADWEKTKKIFIKLKLIDANSKWIANPKNTVVVQVGDQLDGKNRHNDEDAYGEIKILDFMDNVDEQAKMYGGGVYSLLGNHEFMNVKCDFRYVSKNEVINNRCKSFMPGGLLAQRLACSRNVLLKIGDFIFVHGGILPHHLEFIPKVDSIKYVNNLMRLYLLTGEKQDEKAFRSLFEDGDGLLWTRKLNDKKACKKLNKVSDFFNIGHIVIGHTVQDKINSKCDGRIWRVDVGLSRALGNNYIQALEILDNGVNLKKNDFKSIRILK